MIPLYELLYGSKIAKQRVVDEFSGDSLNERWNLVNYNGTGSFNMNDSINGGARLSSGTTSGNHTAADFNDKRQYSNTDSVIIFVTKRVTPAATRSITGLFDEENLESATADGYGILNNTSQTNYQLQSKDGAISSNTDMSVAIDTNWHGFKVEAINGTMIWSYLDGDFAVVKTTNLPNARLQPYLDIRTDTSSQAASADYRYFEAYNL